MDNVSINYLLDLLHDAAARLEDYLEYVEPKESKDPIKEMFKEALFQVLRDIQVTTLSISSDLKEE